MKLHGQIQLYEDNARSWAKLWKYMPEFVQEDLEPDQTLLVHFRSDKDRQSFGDLIGQPLTDRTQSVWWPKEDNVIQEDKRYSTETKINPKYPIYIVSKGRAESRLTSRALEKINVPYHIVVEPQEYKEYAAVIDPQKILTLPFSNLGQGSIPARNWIFDHAIETGAARHWILDDNLRKFYRLNHNMKIPVSGGVSFRAIEDFSDRYENVGMSGMQYHMFAPRKVIVPPLVLNTRVYSCILLNNEIQHRWRGRYNEDTDLSLRILKDGLCTILFNAFLVYKVQTMYMEGGNTEELYQGDGRLKMAESLVSQHPDVARISHKWGRAQHHVDYSQFKKNKLILRDGIVIPEGTNNYSMKLEMTNIVDILTVSELAKFQKLREAFTTGEAGKLLGITAGALNDKLKDWVRLGLIYKVALGRWVKRLRDAGDEQLVDTVKKDVIWDDEPSPSEWISTGSQMGLNLETDD